MTAALHELEPHDDVAQAAAGFASLFVDEHELHRRVAPHMGEKRFRAAVRAAEQHGFPPVKALWGGRYWPAVKKWLDKDNGVENDELATRAEDGEETFDSASEQRGAGAQARPYPPGRDAAVLLDREAGRARPARLPGQVRAVAARR